MDMWGEEKAGGKIYGESNIEIYNTICKIDSQWEFAVWLRELKQGLCDRLKGGMGREMGWMSGREGTWVYLWLILVDVWQKTTKFYKAIILQLKIFKKDNVYIWSKVQAGFLVAHYTSYFHFLRLQFRSRDTNLLCVKHPPGPQHIAFVGLGRQGKVAQTRTSCVLLCCE